MSTEQELQEALAEAIQPKSDQLNADDLLTGPIVATISGIGIGIDDKNKKKIHLEIEGREGRPYKPCKSMLRMLIAMYGQDPVKWIGKRLKLYCDPDVMFGGKKVGGIRISHASDIKKPVAAMITIRQGTKAPWTVKPLEAETPELTEAETSYVADATGEIESADTQESLTAIAFVLKTKTEAVRDALRDIYTSKKKELEA